MKVQCPKCRDIVAMEDFSTSDDGLTFRCPECSELNFVANAKSLTAGDAQAFSAPAPTGLTPGKTASEAAPVKGGIVCPKCGHTQHDGDNCHRCGLNFLRFDPANLPSDPPEASRIWLEVERDIQNRELHEKFVQACAQAQRLDYAGRQYNILEKDPHNTEIVQAMRIRLLSLAEAQLSPGALDQGSRERTQKSNRIILWGILLAALGGFALLIYYSSDMLDRLR